MRRAPRDRHPPAKYSRPSWVTDLIQVKGNTPNDAVLVEEEETETVAESGETVGDCIIDFAKELEEKMKKDEQKKKEIAQKKIEAKNKENEKPKNIETSAKNKKNSKNWIYRFISKIDDGYCCAADGACEQKWTSSKLQTGNIKRHLIRKHAEQLKNSDVKYDKSLCKTSLYTKDDLHKDIITLIAVRCLPLSLIDDPLFRLIIEKLGGKLLHKTQLQQNYFTSLLCDEVEKVTISSTISFVKRKI